ncbi:MAG: 2-hydroxyacyl-CoA dehydratase family protein [Planctomycetes bacterium]|nr:2-hydroxyacyl-CoA dehydratase family protein [Planctomycetota bacterium]
MTALAGLRAAADGREGALRAGIARGREVVGLPVPLAPPPEIVEAAGAIPFRLLAAGDADAELRALAALGRDACGTCRGLLGAAMVAHPPVTCLAAGTACDRMRRMLEAFGSTGLPVFTVAVPRVRGISGQRKALAQELRLFAGELSVRTGVPATPERLAAAIRRGNAARRILREADGLRRLVPPRATGTEYFDLVRAHGLLPVEDFLALAAAVPGELAAREPPSPDPVRVLLTGPTLLDGRRDALAILEAGGRAVAVADVTDSGTLASGEDVPEDGDPFLGLATHLLAHPVLAAPLRPSRAFRERFAGTLRASGAEGVLFRGVPFCRPFNSEVPALRLLSTVPFLEIREEGAAASGQTRTRIEAFVEMLLARRLSGGPP